MNKYQDFLMNKHNSEIFYIINGKETPCFKDDKITIKQDENITVTKYSLHIINKSINTIYAIKNIDSKKTEKIINSTSSEIGELKNFSIKIDFDNRIDAVKITFVNNLADDLLIPIVYKEADKEKYYAKIAQEHKDNLLKTADIKVATGADLVNIYFQPCCDEYDHTEILLFIPKECKRTQNKPDTWSMIKKCKVSPDDFYESINGLAYGKYSFILKQYDKKNNIIFETNNIAFEISEPTIPEFSPLNII